MVTFNQQGQTVNTQYNAETINIGSIETKEDVLTAIQKLQGEVEKAVKGNAINEEAATEVEYSLKKAVQQMKKPEADKSVILQHMETATKYVTGANNLVNAFKAVVVSIGNILI